MRKLFLTTLMIGASIGMPTANLRLDRQAEYSEIFSQPIIKIQPGTLFFATPESRTTLAIINSGTTVLSIDSMRTYRRYGWGVQVMTKDTVFALDYCECSSPPFRKQLNFMLAPHDSARLVIIAPDLCPICKTAKDRYPFTDTLSIFSNDTLHSPVKIFAHGEGRPSAVSEGNWDKPDGFVLLQNYPNPIWRGTETKNASTTICFRLPAASQVVIKIYNSFGQEVHELVNQHFETGQHQVEWNSHDHPRNQLASGVYFMRMTVKSRFSSEFVRIRKILLVE